MRIACCPSGFEAASRKCSTEAIWSAERSWRRSFSVRRKKRSTARFKAGRPAALLEQDLFDAVTAEFREGEMLPPDDAAEEWLKLLDHHPEQVVGISSFRRGRQAEERLVNQII